MPDDQLALVLNQELAAQVNSPQFTELLQTISTYEVQSANIRVTNDQEYQMACDSLVALAVASKQVKAMKTGILAYPKLFAESVKGAFGGVETRCVNIRGKFENHTKPYKMKKDAEYAKQQAEAAAAVVEAPAVTDVDSEEKPPESPTPPLQSTKATIGGSVSYRKGPPKIEVINPAKLIRAATDHRNKVPVDVIAIDAAALRKAVGEGLLKPKQWEKYGVTVTEQEEMVVRT